MLDPLQQKLMENQRQQMAMASAQQGISLQIYVALAVDHIRGKKEVIPGDDGVKLEELRDVAKAANKAALVLMESWGMLELRDDEKKGQ